MKSKFTYRMLLAGLLIGLASCIYDDLELNDGPIGKGEGNVSFSVTFDALTASRLGKQSRSTQGIGGDAIRNINDLCILWYDLEGNLAGSRYLERSQLTIDEIDRPASQTDAKTEQATFETRIPYGRYRMYAVANMGDLSASHAAEIAKEQDFRVISLAWEPGDIRKNCEMSGYFTQTDTSSASEDNEAPEITVNRTYTKLHAWIRRAASKVTVSFDTEKLYDNVYVYIKSARICNVPRTCTLIENNDETRINKETDLHPAGDTIEYGSGPDFNSWPCLTRGDNPLDGDAAKLHANDARSLFFYENMQGTGQSKLQDADHDNQIDNPGGNTPGDKGYRDGKPCGTYIEVEGYYISNRVESGSTPGRGKIFYRFMLGQNETTDYNAKRNYHYKLTLRFQGNANDIDWHIEYDEEPGIYVPNPYFISYLYDHKMTLPVKIKGKLTGKLKAEIIENNWGPHGAGSEFEYYTGQHGSVATLCGNPNGSTPEARKLDNPLLGDGPWNGFLSLTQTNIKIIGAGISWWTGYNYFYWKQKDFAPAVSSYSNLKADETGQSPRGIREYETSPGHHPDAKDGDYEVTTDQETNTTILQIPCYTRALNLTNTTAFTGNNPFFAYQRSAKVKLTATVDGKEEIDTVTIFQVRRVVNPKGVYRRHDNDKPFNVVLTRRLSEDATAYTPFQSEGPWDATIEKGADWIKVNNVLGGRASGGTHDYIKFTIQPKGTIASHECRFAVILVRYHNHTCYHRIFVRQGYAPADIAGDGTKWHTSNLLYANNEAESPLDEGSMFRYGNIGQPIDAVNNKFDNFADNSTTEFKLAPTSEGKKSTWGQISNTDQNSKGFSEQTQTIDGRTCHVAEFKDFESLRNKCQMAFGIIYGDEATETSMNFSDAHGYAHYNTDNTNKGMRGCVVFNPNTGANIFFPGGVAGYGHRKNIRDEGGRRAVLRYASRGALYTEADVRYRPLLYTIYTQFGAIYWLNQLSNNATSWDINVSTYDFNTFANNAFLAATGWGTIKESDAAFIRLVE